MTKWINKAIAVALMAGAGIFFINPSIGRAAEAVTPAVELLAGVEIKAQQHKDVCMVTNNVGLMKMIPVKVEGKTYYGCCQGCVGKLKNNRSYRYTTDPVTGREIDKAKAFIVADKAKKALYFESKETAEKFFASLKPVE